MKNNNINISLKVFYFILKVFSKNILNRFKIKNVCKYNYTNFCYFYAYFNFYAQKGVQVTCVHTNL